ncbi:MAG: sigma-70 family RNA polymerase sigma factor [Myxococcales bacterium]|nr:sigma-70 family RNA polymerase sigma factor [Myxococcales bacterium]
MAAGSEGPSDATLVAAMARGDQAALAVLYDRHAGLLLGAARRFLGSTAAAEDLVHDVLLEAWRRAASFDPGRGSVRTWLLVRLRSRALDRLRRGQRGRAALAALTATPATDAVGDPERGSEAARAREALASLPEGHRQVLELAYFGGLTMSEIADALGVPIGTVKSRSAGALSKLRRALDPTPATEGGE